MELGVTLQELESFLAAKRTFSVTYSCDSGVQVEYYSRPVNRVLSGSDLFDVEASRHLEVILEWEYLYEGERYSVNRATLLRRLTKCSEYEVHFKHRGPSAVRAVLLDIKSVLWLLHQRAGYSSDMAKAATLAYLEDVCERYRSCLGLYLSACAVELECYRSTGNHIATIRDSIFLM